MHGTTDELILNNPGSDDGSTVGASEVVEPDECATEVDPELYADGPGPGTLQ